MRSRDKQEQMYQNCLIGREPEKASLSQTTASELFHDLMGSTFNEVFQQIKDFITKLIRLSDTTVLNNILSLRSLALTRTAHAPLPGCTAQFVICKTLALRPHPCPAQPYLACGWRVLTYLLTYMMHNEQALVEEEATS
eukprot:scaffold1487_cov130-Skeletonema_marinoi.AAC.6